MTCKIFTRLLFISCALGVCLSSSLGQQKPVDSNAPVVEQVRLRLKDGSYLTVDDAWETPQGIWYRQGGISHLATKDRVVSIARTTAPTPVPETETEIPPLTVSQQPGIFDKPVWIYLVGGARVEADSANQSAVGVWYKRGPLSIFIEHSRVDHLELEDAETVATANKERGWSTGSTKLDGLIRENGTKYRVDPYLIFLVMEQESHFNTRVVSPKGARGLMQLMPGTSARFGVRRPHDPAQNISGGTRYLRQLLDKFNNRVDLALASYNAGEGAVIKFGHKVPPYRETRNYVKRISYRYRQRSVARAKQKPSSDATPGAGER